MRMQSGTKSCWKHCCSLIYILISKIWCAFNKMEQLNIQQKFPCKSSGQRFRAESFLVSRTSPGPPARLTIQYQTTYSGAALKVRYTKHVLPLLLTYKSILWCVFRESPWKCYNVWWQLFHRDCRSVMNDMKVNYEVSYSNNNDWDEFSLKWNVRDCVNEHFSLVLKKRFHFKNRQIFFDAPCNRRILLCWTNSNRCLFLMFRFTIMFTLRWLIAMMILTKTFCYKISCCTGRFTLSVTFPFLHPKSTFNAYFSCVITRSCSHWQESQPHVSVLFQLRCWGRFVWSGVRNVSLFRCTNSFVFPSCNGPNRTSAASLLSFIDHTQVDTHTFGVGFLWTSDQPVADAATYTTHKKHKGRTPMPSAEFEFPFPEITQLLIYALDRTGTGMSRDVL